jgi:hypothetical protein
MECEMSNNSESGCSDNFISHVDLFIVEGIFKEHRYDDNQFVLSDLFSSYKHFDDADISKQWSDWVNHQPMSGLAAAASKLQFLAENDEFQFQPLAWGNTNSVSIS